ncbi:MAG TPA: hypothetical protein VGJ86_13550 [Acidimicrobiales bacterium]
MEFGTLKVGDQTFEVVDLKPEGGKLYLVAYRSGPADLAVSRAEWTAPDGSLICAFEPFHVSTGDIADARTADDVTVFQAIAISEVVRITEPSGVPMAYLPVSRGSIGR